MVRGRACVNLVGGDFTLTPGSSPGQALALSSVSSTGQALRERGLSTRCGSDASFIVWGLVLRYLFVDFGLVGGREHRVYLFEDLGYRSRGADLIA